MPIDPKIHEQAVAIERVHFVKTDKRVNPKKINPFCYLEGTIPILVTAAHAVRYQSKKTVKSSDEFTGALAYLLNQLTGCHTLAVSKFYGGDPNQDEPCIFKAELAKIHDKQQLSLVLDLQGAKRSADFEVMLETIDGKLGTVGQGLVRRVQTAFNEVGISPTMISSIKKEPRNTILGFSAGELGIPTVRLLLNRKYRVPHQNGQAFTKALGALAEGIIL